MEKPKPIERIYPEQRGPLADFHAWDAHRQTLDKVYDLHDKMNAFMHETSGKMSNVGQTAPPFIPPGFPTVKAGQPNNGDTLRYDSSIGQFKVAP